MYVLLNRPEKPSISVNTLRPRQNGHHFTDIFKCIFLKENIWITIKISLKFVPMGPINNIPALVQIMAWHRPGDKPLSESMMVSLLTHICVTRPQWVKEPLAFEGVEVMWQFEFTAHIEEDVGFTLPHNFHITLRHRTVIEVVPTTCNTRKYFAHMEHFNALKMLFSNIVSWLKVIVIWFNIVIWFKFHWSLFLGSNCQSVNIGLGNGLAPSHLLNQCWPRSWTHICTTKRWFGSVLAIKLHIFCTTFITLVIKKVPLVLTLSMRGTKLSRFN